jgi:cytochrome c oxidase subunit 2
MNVVSGHGSAARSEALLGWWLIGASVVVIAVVATLVLIIVVRAVGRNRDADPAGRPVIRSGGALRWVVIGGIIVPAVILVGTLVFSTGTLKAVTTPPSDPAATVRVIGHRWWWEFIYTDPDASKTVVTANELHVPVGRPVRLELSTADVIHSFWVPQLAGKTDLIPGQTNHAWIEADTAGIYRGQCTEYCGMQHANMAVYAIAESPQEFAAWLARQRDSATAPSDPEARSGLAVFQKSACATCHAIRGTDALGAVGPDLTHLESRLTLGAGVLEHTRGNMMGWITNSQAIKPGNDMPPMPLPPDELHALVAYLETLK